MQSSSIAESKPVVLVFSVDADNCAYKWGSQTCSSFIINFITRKVQETKAVKAIITIGSGRQDYMTDVLNASHHETPKAVTGFYSIKSSVEEVLARDNVACQVEFDPTLAYDVFNSDPDASLTHDFVKQGCKAKDAHYYKNKEYSPDYIKAYAVYRAAQKAALENQAEIQVYHIDDDKNDRAFISDAFAVESIYKQRLLRLELPNNVSITAVNQYGDISEKSLQGTGEIDPGYMFTLRERLTRRVFLQESQQELDHVNEITKQEALERSITGLAIAYVRCPDKLKKELIVDKLKELKALCRQKDSWDDKLWTKICTEVRLPCERLDIAQQHEVKKFVVSCLASAHVWEVADVIKATITKSTRLLSYVSGANERIQLEERERIISGLNMLRTRYEESHLKYPKLSDNALYENISKEKEVALPFAQLTMSEQNRIREYASRSFYYSDKNIEKAENRLIHDLLDLLRHTPKDEKEEIAKLLKEKIDALMGRIRQCDYYDGKLCELSEQAFNEIRKLDSFKDIGEFNFCNEGNDWVDALSKVMEFAEGYFKYGDTNIRKTIDELAKLLINSRLKKEADDDERAVLEIRGYVKQLKDSGDYSALEELRVQIYGQVINNSALPLQPEARWRLRVFVEMEIGQVATDSSKEAGKETAVIRACPPTMFYTWDGIVDDFITFFNSLKNTDNPVFKGLCDRSSELLKPSFDRRPYEIKYSLIALFAEAHHLLKNLNDETQGKYKAQLADSTTLAERIKNNSMYTLEWQSLENRRKPEAQENSSESLPACVFLPSSYKSMW